MYSYFNDQIVAKADEKSEISREIVLKLLISTLVAPFGGKANINLSVDFTFQSISAIPATRQTYLSISSLNSVCLEQYSKCFKK